MMKYLFPKKAKELQTVQNELSELKAIDELQVKTISNLSANLISFYDDDERLAAIDRNCKQLISYHHADYIIIICVLALLFFIYLKLRKNV